MQRSCILLLDETNSFVNQMLRQSRVANDLQFMHDDINCQDVFFCEIVSVGDELSKVELCGVCATDIN